MRRKRHIPPDKAREAVLGDSWYYKPPPPVATWPKCSSCSTPARILDEENKECIRCRVARAKQARIAGGPF